MGEIKYNGRTYSGLIQANGCFIDTDNVIVARTQYSSSFTYTATEDCYISLYMVLGASIEIDGEVVFACYSNNSMADGIGLYLRKGQTLSVTGSGNNSSYVVYGLMQGSPITFLSEYASACYDTNEREVGCFVDGKPLYQKTLIYTVTSPISSDTVLGSISDIDKVASIECIAHYDGHDRGWLMPMSVSSYSSNISYNNGNIILNITNDTYGVDWVFYVTVQYTKTTDTAGSGKLTPTGFETHHYSTNEQIVGTWIDGKPLYEVTVEVDNPTINSSSDNKYVEAPYSSSVIDFAKCINCEVYDSTDSRWYTLPYERMISSENINIMAMRLANGSYAMTAHWKSNQNYNITKVRYTIQFTKTTD